MVSAGHVGGTRGSGIVSSAADVLWMRWMCGVGRVCEMYMCLARGGVGGEWMRGLGLGFTNPVGTGVVDGRVSVFWLWWCRWGVDRGLDQGLERWGGVMSGFFV